MERSPSIPYSLEWIMLCSGMDQTLAGPDQLSGARMGQTGIRRTAFALLAVLIVYAAFAGVGP